MTLLAEATSRLGATCVLSAEKAMHLATALWAAAKAQPRTGKRQGVQVKELTWSVPSARAQAAKLRLPASSETWPATWSVQRTLVPELQDSTAWGGMPGCRVLVACMHQRSVMPGQSALCDLPASSGTVGRSDWALQVQ